MSAPTTSAPLRREFDQIVSSDIKIKKIYNSNEYKITLVGNTSKVLLYQIWSDSNTPEGKH